MYQIVILSSSIRKGRDSHLAALYLAKFFNQQSEIKAEILDLQAYNFPLFNERLRFLENPDQQVIEFAEKIKNADAIIIVTPEYNGGYPASLKNVVDLLYDEWKNKPIAFCTCSSGNYAGTQVLVQMQSIFLKIGALIVPSTLPIAQVQNTFNEHGELVETGLLEGRTQKYYKDIINYIDRFN